VSGRNVFDKAGRIRYMVFMRLFWLTVLVCFLSVSTHEAVAHAGTCTCAAGFADKHHDGGSKPGDSADTDDDHHGSDSHGHFRGAVSAPAKPIITDLVMLGTPVAFNSIGILPQEHLSLSLRWVVGLPAQDLPRYLSAQSLLL
jgi:hypothetical protein